MVVGLLCDLTFASVGGVMITSVDLAGGGIFGDTAMGG